MIKLKCQQLKYKAWKEKGLYLHINLRIVSVSDADVLRSQPTNLSVGPNDSS